MGGLSPTHWLIVLVVLVLLFGAKKLPEMARSVGRSSRILKSEMRGMRDDEPGDDASTSGGRADPGRPDSARPATGTGAEPAPPQGENRP